MCGPASHPQDKDFIHIFNENLDGPKMKQILKENLIPSAEALFTPGQWYFLHDNDKKFHSKVVQEWLHQGEPHSFSRSALHSRTMVLSARQRQEVPQQGRAGVVA